MSGIIINPYSFATVSPFTSTKSLNFDGVDDYVGTGITNTGTNDISVSCWIKTTETFSYTVSRCAFGGRSNIGGTNYTLGRLGSGFATPDDMVVRLNNTLGTTKLNDGDWHNIVYTYNFTTKEVKAYVDGNTTAEATLTFAAWNTNYQIAIGWNGFDTSYYFEGNVDECAYFTRVLGASDITEIYNNGAPGDISGISDLENWWRMGEDSTFSSPQILMPEQNNKDKVSNFSMAFDGVNDYVFVGNDSSLQPTAAITLSAWVNQKTAQWADRGIINSLKYSYGSANGYTLDASVRPDGNLYFNFQIETSAGIQQVKSLAYAGSYNLNEWYHYMATFDGNTLTLYVNGVAVGTTSYTGTILYDATFYGVNINGKPYRLMHADVDEVSIFSSAKAIGDLWDGSGKPTDLTGESGLVSWWRMGEEATFSTNWTIPDQIGSNDGTSANMTIEDRTGDAPDSSNNALSSNMVEADIEEEAP